MQSGPRTVSFKHVLSGSSPERVTPFSGAPRGSRISTGVEVPVESVVVEIRAAEGGRDARLLVREQFTLYSKLGVRRSL
jgi:hypothetical protein